MTTAKTPGNISGKIPATIVTGFLGAGKTTLLANLLREAKGKRIALIVNEFGDMGFDGSLVDGCADPDCAAEDVVELTNGCICCTVADDFLPTMEMLIARDEAPDHIVIETSGLALPAAAGARLQLAERQDEGHGRRGRHGGRCGRRRGRARHRQRGGACRTARRRRGARS